jgi:glucokinase
VSDSRTLGEAAGGTPAPAVDQTSCPVALVFDFGGTKMEVALAAAGQHVIGRTTLRTDADNGADQAVGRALDAGRELLLAHKVDTPTAIGVSTMGYTREEGVDLAPNVPGWQLLQLPARMRRAFPGVPLALDNDVRAAAKAELKWGALAGVRTGLYVNFGTGVASTLIVDGEPLLGSHGAAGEIGYWLVRPSRLSRGGAAEGFDQTTEELSTLEVEVGGAGVRDRARGIGIDGGLAELISSSSSAAVALVRDVLTQIAVHVTNMAILLDPERIVLGGGYTGAGDTLVSVIRESLREHAPFAPDVRIGRFGSDAGLFGAIALAEAAGAGA